MSHLGKKRLILSGKKNAKGALLQGKLYIKGLAVTFFVQCDEKGNPSMYTAKDGTPLLIISVNAFDNSGQDNVFGRGGNRGGYNRGNNNNNSNW